jgi:hypothetical protein
MYVFEPETRIKLGVVPEEVIVLFDPFSVMPLLLVPAIVSLSVGDPVPIPILPFVPSTTRLFWLYLPITTLSVENTSRIGSPDVSLTDIRLPVTESAMLNSDPLAPLNDNDPSVSTSSLMVPVVTPVKSILGLVLVPLLGVMTMSGIVNVFSIY